MEFRCLNSGMKKEENQKRNAALQNEYFSRSRSHSPKAYLGCDTCKIKHVKSISKLSESGVQEKQKPKKSQIAEKSEGRFKNQKIKLVDLCDEDKKRLVQLIEELTIFAEKNEKLKKKLEKLNKDHQEQQSQLLKQANLFLEEKNFYINEVNKYKSKLEAIENEMKSKMSQWKDHEKSKDDEIIYLAKALQKSLREKNELHVEMTNLKISLKNSLESFQKLRAEVTELQFKEKQITTFKSTSSQTENKESVSKEKHKPYEGDSEGEEYLSTYNQGSIHAKSSLDLINDKLENVYQLLKKRRESLQNTTLRNCETEFALNLGNEKSDKERRSEEICQKSARRIQAGTVKTSTPDDADQQKSDTEENEEDFLEPFEEGGKSWMQVEKILRKVEKPYKINVNECTQTLENNNLSNLKTTKFMREKGRNVNFLQNKLIQKNNFFKSSDHQYDEDRLLEELFYSDQSTNLGFDYLLENKMPRKISSVPPLPL